MSNEPSFAGALLEPEYEPPGDDVVAAIRLHLAEHHDRELELRRDVAFPGNPSPDAAISLELASPYRGARFWCSICGRGQVFLVGEPLYGPERTALLRRQHRELGFLLRGLPPERCDAVAEAWDRGELSPALIDASLSRRSQQTRRRPDPAAARRKAGCQEWMVARYAEIGHVETVEEELEKKLADPTQRNEIPGADRPLRLQTLRAYWREVPLERREAARRAFRALPEAERKRRTALRYRKPTP